MATTVDEYLSALPQARREALSAVREVILANLPEGYEEGIQYGGIGYFVPHSICPDGYHCDAEQPVPFAGLANGKGKMSLHFFGIYVVTEAKEQLVESWKATGKKLDMGASCIRFKKIEDVPLQVVGDAIASMPVDLFLERYEEIVPAKAKKKRTGRRG
jgi:hypothetical protein